MIILLFNDCRWDHLVDENSEEKGREGKNHIATDLMLGSKLDKGDRQPSGSRGHKEENNGEGDGEVVCGGDDNDNGDVEGGASVMSLCSDDFKFSTTSH